MSDLLHALKSEKEETITEVDSDDSDLNAISEEDSTIVKLVNKILIDAYDEGVSDIHVEPGETQLAARPVRGSQRYPRAHG